MISQGKGKCTLTHGGKSENTGDSMNNTSSSLKCPLFSQVRTAKFKILQILALAHRPSVLQLTYLLTYFNPRSLTTIQEFAFWSRVEGN